MRIANHTHMMNKASAPMPKHAKAARVRLLNERARCVCEIGRLKKELGIEVYQPTREKEVINHVRAIAAEGPLGPDAIARLFERIIDEARRLERRVVHDDEAAE